MAFKLKPQPLAFEGSSRSEPQAPAEAGPSKPGVDRFAVLNEGTATSVDVTYSVVWTAKQPALPFSQTAISSHSLMGRLPQPGETGNPMGDWMGRFSQLRETYDPIGHWMGRLPQPGETGNPRGNIRITGPTSEERIWNIFQARNAARSGPTQQPLPKGKIPCVATLDRGRLGARCTCIYDTVTDRFDTFGANDETWVHRNDYGDYGDVQMSTKKWVEGSWVSVEDDNKNEFLFLTVEKGFGLVRVWRPNIVAKRNVGYENEKLTHEETLRLGLNDDDGF